MEIVLLLAVVSGLSLALLLGNSYGTKRGCGRGCAACGSRAICYRRKKKK